MITGIDHLVILVHDLTSAMDDYARLGFSVQYGGEHPSSTHNALIAFEDGAYIELIAFKQPDEPSDHPWHDALELGEGLVAFAVGSSDLEADLALMRGRHLPVGETSDGGRLRPDGRRLEWRTVGIGRGKRGRERPFVIEDVTPRDWRVAGGWATRHANSVVGVIDVTLVVASLDQAAADLADMLNVDEPAAVAGSVGRQISFVTPRGAIIAIQPEAGTPLAEAVAARGDYLAGATLAIRAQGGEPTFRTELAHSAALSLEPR